MNSSTWSQSVPGSNKATSQRTSLPPAREWDTDDADYEQWHQSHLGNIIYLAIFACVGLLTVVAFVPVWLLLQVQRITGFLRGLVTGGSRGVAAVKSR